MDRHQSTHGQGSRCCTPLSSLPDKCTSLASLFPKGLSGKLPDFRSKDLSAKHSRQSRRTSIDYVPAFTPLPGGLAHCYYPCPFEALTISPIPRSCWPSGLLCPISPQGHKAMVQQRLKAFQWLLKKGMHRKTAIDPEI